VACRLSPGGLSWRVLQLTQSSRSIPSDAPKKAARTLRGPHRRRSHRTTRRAASPHTSEKCEARRGWWSPAPFLENPRPTKPFPKKAVKTCGKPLFMGYLSDTPY
jgi:hypothetical protein